jgi:hypothetical protein
MPAGASERSTPLSRQQQSSNASPRHCALSDGLLLVAQSDTLCREAAASAVGRTQQLAGRNVRRDVTDAVDRQPRVRNETELGPAR